MHQRNSGGCLIFLRWDSQTPRHLADVVPTTSQIKVMPQTVSLMMDSTKKYLVPFFELHLNNIAIQLDILYVFS